MKKLSKGFSGIKLLFILAFLILVASAASYYLLNANQVKITFPGIKYPKGNGGVTSGTEIDNELKSIDEGSPESDVKSIDSDASSL